MYKDGVHGLLVGVLYGGIVFFMNINRLFLFGIGYNNYLKTNFY